MNPDDTRYHYMTVVPAAADAHNSTTTLHVSTGFITSSIFKLAGLENTFNGGARTISTIRIDTLCAEKHLTGHYLVKVDVQGAKLSVMDGMADILEKCEYITLEVSNFQRFASAPTINDVIL